MAQPIDTILHGDCIAGMNALSAGSVDVVFADPPFNIGYDYDVYDDRLERDKYLAWSHDWIAAVHRVLKSDGAFWLAIGDEYAADPGVVATRRLRKIQEREHAHAAGDKGHGLKCRSARARDAGPVRGG